MAFLGVILTNVYFKNQKTNKSNCGSLGASVCEYALLKLLLSLIHLMQRRCIFLFDNRAQSHIKKILGIRFALEYLDVMIVLQYVRGISLQKNIVTLS